MTIIIDRETFIDRETSRSILFSEPYDYYYYRPRDLLVYFVFGTL